MIDREERALVAEGLELRAEGEGTLTLQGYAAIFNSLSEPLPGGNGTFREVIRPGAFRDSIAGGADVRLLLNHDGLPLARTASGTLQLREDGRGLAMTAKLDATDPDVQRLVPKVRRGDLSQMSFGFVTRRDHWRQESGGQVRDLLQVDLLDVSAVTYPAYRATEIALRSLARATATPAPSLDALYDRLTLCESRAAVSTRPTAGMAAAAREGLRLHEEGRSGDGLKPETVRRANIIARRESLTPDHVIEMSAWFARHASDRKAGWDKPGQETPGFVAWQLWGGDAARDWSTAKAKALKAE